ncbi:MAG: alpha-ketoglutarate-dependent dioxygenase AlkB, partial [Bacteroidia bacterium]
YGYRYDYKSRRINYDMYLGALPDWGQQLALRMYAEGILPFVADQLIVNEYMPGQGITAHIDCEPCFEDTIASLSLNSACLMDFTQAQTLETTSLFLEPSSLLVLSDEARYNWKHGIANRKKDKYNNQLIERGRRVSLTFRKVILK